MRSLSTTAAALCLALSFPLSVSAADELRARSATPAEIGTKARCSVKNVTFEVTATTQVIDYKGKSYYFCCASCLTEFRKSPDKFADASLATRAPTAAELGKTVTCQVMGTRFEVGKSTPVIEYKGKSYYFCCDHCVQEFKADPDKFAMK